MGRMEAHLVETATKVTTTRNEAGDIVYGTTSSSPCLYRDISDLNRVPNREIVRLDGILWFQANEDVVLGDVYYHPSEGYLRIERIIKAKRLLTDNDVQFIKCFVSKQRQVS